MSISFPNNRASAPLSRRSVVLGLAASSLPSPAIVRMSCIMPVRRVSLTETERPWAGYIERLFYNSLAAGLRRGRISTVINSRVPSFSEAERLVRYVQRNGWIVEPPSVPS